MTNAPDAQAAGAQFMRRTSAAATKLLDQWVGPERAAEAKGRIASAFQAAAMAARDPSDFYACTPGSIAHCVAVAALTGMMPGTGAAALAYLVPRRPRKNEDPQLQYQLSHRGLAALARRADLVLIALPCAVNDVLEIKDGEVSRFEPNIDDPPVTWADLRGIVIVIKTSSGQVLFRGWVAKRLIDIRRDASDSYQFAVKNEWAQRTDPWHKWPIEMSMKAAMHYAVSRGWAVIDDTEAVRALSLDSGDVIDVTPGDADAGVPRVKLEDALNAKTDNGKSPEAGERGALIAAAHALLEEIDALKPGETKQALFTLCGEGSFDDLDDAQLADVGPYLLALRDKVKAAVAAELKPPTSTGTPSAGTQRKLV